MDLSLEETLYQAILAENYDTISQVLSKGANPNKTVKQGKTCLGEAARMGNIDILKMLLSANYETSTQKVSPNNLTTRKRHKRKLKHHGRHEETVVKCKNLNDRIFKDFNFGQYDTMETDINEKTKNQGYFVFIHSEGSSSDESKVGSMKSPLSPTLLTPSPQADLEWDEEIGNVAPTTSEDETCASMYKWYAAILESTGEAIASASAISNGINQQDTFTRTALHYASEQNHLNVVKLLIEAGCKVDIPTADGLTPLHIAVVNNNIEVVKVLLMAGSGVNLETPERKRPLHYAALQGYLSMVKELVRDGALVEARDRLERTALFVAVEKGHVDVVKYFISVGANVDVEDLQGHTPLYEAVYNGSTEMTEVLLRAGARITYTDTLLHHAIRRKKEDMIKLLTKFCGCINLHNDSGDTPLLLATKSSQPRIMRFLLKRGADVNARNSLTLETALHIAVEHVFDTNILEKIIKLLLDYKINVSSCALVPGDTALNRALLIHRDDAAVLLIRYGVDVNNIYHTCCLDNLSIACTRQSYSLVSLMLKAGHRGVVLPPCEKKLKPGAMMDWYKANFNQPLRLQDLCRIKIRDQGKHTVLYRHVESLPIPKLLKGFLMMEYED